MSGSSGVPVWAWALLPRPRTIRDNLARVAAAELVPRTPNLWQVFLGTMYMRHRLLFRSNTVGTSQQPVRATRRARLLHWRAVRGPVAIASRAVAPLDLSGLALTEQRLIIHLLGAHHDRMQFVYDLELLSLHPGGIDRLEAAVREVVESEDARSRWLRDLVVHEGYHEALLAAVEAWQRGELQLSEAEARSPDITLTAWLGWCAAQPETPSATWRALRQG